jgi:hypothetical protein
MNELKYFYGVIRSSSQLRWMRTTNIV